MGLEKAEGTLPGKCCALHWFCRRACWEEVKAHIERLPGFLAGRSGGEARVALGASRQRSESRWWPLLGSACA